MFKPTTLHDAYCLAKLQDATLSSIKRSKPILEKPPNLLPKSSLTTPFSTYSSSYFTNKTHSSTFASNPLIHQTQLLDPIIPLQISDQRDLQKPCLHKTLRTEELKFYVIYCDEKYTLGHKCKDQEYRLEILENIEEEMDSEVQVMEDCHCSGDSRGGDTSYFLASDCWGQYLSYYESDWQG